MKVSFFYILLILSSSSFGQAPRVKTIKHVNPITKEIYIFPKVIVLSSDIATRKINNKLRESILNLSANTKDANIFDSVWRTDNQSPTIHNLSYRVVEISSSLISLSISGEGCGAYCESFINHFTFNVRSGNQLSLDSLFSKEGLKIFIKTLNDNKKAKLDNKLKQIDRSLQLLKTNHDVEDKKRLSGMRSIYLECLDKEIDIKYFGGTEFLIKEGRLIVYTDRCSAHYNMALDELWTFKTQTVLANNKKMLSNFGLSLIRK